MLCSLFCQIDGSTLKTLCMQHGPLQSFHLYLNHSIALAKYSSREEANKVLVCRLSAHKYFLLSFKELCICMLRNYEYYNFG
jgi:hypothetical protein